MKPARKKVTIDLQASNIEQTKLDRMMYKEVDMALSTSEPKAAGARSTNSRVRANGGGFQIVGGGEMG